ncbi:hypothetical protein NX786_09750 [Telluria mixta]|uniref:Uncharacterized protein n=1 Tax=Telluria mixta TaxID=34071 RepID=A0ABT2BX50_9BURK|nr:hypothetical protein [Telluria mixta]MCS0629616.1 hypothetical protein [Telluria mixta]WEM96813.1 hypothetical protein P0M04_03465 [Telluria mixta]
MRNHAIVHGQGRKGWRLASALDVVPNPAETPHRLVMQLSRGRFALRATPSSAMRFASVLRAATLHARMIENLARLRDR